MARHVGYQYFSVVMIALSIATGVESNYTLEILLLGYENPSHMAKSLENFRSGCCELDTTTPCRPCDNAFSVCVREVRLGVVEGDCDLLEESTLIAEDDDDLMFTIGEDIGGLSNPLTVSGEMWPGTVEIVFTVFDLDLTSTIGSSSDLVDNVFIYPDVPAGLSANDPFSDPTIFTGKASYSHLELAFRLTCGPHFYGPNCTFCVPSNDSTGHYSCDDRTGSKVCLEGYQGPETNCTDCVPASDCNHDGGYCILPGECLCHRGFTGDYCDLYTITTHPISPTTLNGL
ncbi:Protein jagged-1 [Geodia barretti]|uniref:Protein jagged-1 n=1 Tax=Geodia barretti TaxID=519541 RepID=A0AA35VYF4_GEOBA|nr:Protein jagged-1 [Geodia barretti]